ncbi:hypothetical protein PHLGIDRAFT_215384 [Phlebiopsis gigantea 11061_1 CR5-6]|uniref:Uncharacterized protein n=1 Tax=Phlebiopsis gigantea (strain 11061_1 CR5-6) TaxID=745531 RepID=A0A0C3S2R6_PHLG1|nr:hypothetical protein PHLGIDRAFT_215384 [Phlebiopsis gigantea 11061_1 CR5-6]
MRSENDHVGDLVNSTDVEQINPAPNEGATTWPTTGLKAHLGTGSPTQTPETSAPNNSDDDGEEEFNVEEALVEM